MNPKSHIEFHRNQPHTAACCDGLYQSFIVVDLAMAVTLANSIVYFLANASLLYPAGPQHSVVINGTTIGLTNTPTVLTNQHIPDPPQIAPQITTIFGKREYHFDYTPKVDWHQADWLCRRKGMQLPSIYSDVEYELMTSEIQKRGLADTPLWLSGNNIDSPNHYIWGANGRWIMLDKWKPGFPEEGRAHCVYMSQGSWANHRCDLEMRFFCEEYL